MDADRLPAISTPALMRRVAANIGAIAADGEIDPKKRIRLYTDYADALEKQDFVTTGALMADFSRRPGFVELRAKLVQKYNFRVDNR